MKKRPVIHPSDQVHDTYRERNAGLVNVPMNSKSSTDNFHVDRSRLGTHGEWEGEGYRQVPNHIKEKARREIGELKQKSSFTNLNAKPECGIDICCEPQNPLYKKRHRR